MMAIPNFFSPSQAGRQQTVDSPCFFSLAAPKFRGVACWQAWTARGSCLIKMLWVSNKRESGNMSLQRSTKARPVQQLTSYQ